MNNVIVIFGSKYGATKCYAEWISKKLSCPLIENKDVNTQNLKQAKIIIYGGGLYAGGVSGIKLLVKNWNLISDKKIILFTCGLANPEEPENVSHIKEALAKTLPSEMLTKIELFHFRGGIDYSKLTFIHKVMMSMMHKVLLKKDSADLSSEDNLFLETYGKKVDFANRESIQPLVDYVLSLHFE